MASHKCLVSRIRTEPSSHWYSRPRQTSHRRYRAKTVPRSDASLQTAKCMEDIYHDLARRVWEAAEYLQTPNKYIVAVAGVPGSGKSTTAFRVAEYINAFGGVHPGGSSATAVVVQMDGFHYYRAQLDAMPDPKEAHAKRGAHWTFDAARFVQAVQELRDYGEGSLPSFDHAAGDPVEDDVIVLPHHSVVIIEGLYVLYDEHPWSKVKDLVDESWFVDCDLDAALQRVVERQVGNGALQEEAAHRVASNDRPNALLVSKTQGRADHVLPSLPLGKA